MSSYHDNEMSLDAYKIKKTLDSIDTTLDSIDTSLSAMKTHAQSTSKALGAILECLDKWRQGIDE